MKHIFLLEELSMEHFLRGLLPRMFPSWKEEEHYQLRAHNGKSDLQKALPPFMKSTHHNSPICVVIIHDQDKDDCIALKKHIRSLCKDGNVPTLIRIACQELEAWYLGDKDALAKVYPAFEKLKNKRQFKTLPDMIDKPSELLKKSISNFSKTSAAKAMGKEISFTKNTSVSFNQLISGLNRFIQQPQ